LAYGKNAALRGGGGGGRVLKVDGTLVWPLQCHQTGSTALGDDGMFNGLISPIFHREHFTRQSGGVTPILRVMT
jgi:hypothetical protein